MRMPPRQGWQQARRRRRSGPGPISESGSGRGRMAPPAMRDVARLPRGALCSAGRSAFTPNRSLVVGKTMRLSRYFLPILRENPKEAEIVSHRLMLRAGMLRQEAAGMYAFLPLGFRVLKRIEQIVREEQDRAGTVELLMPTLHLAALPPP